MRRLLDIAVRSHIGKARQRNEDAVAAAPERGLVVVADGMGGHPAGHIASRLAVDALIETFPSREGRSEAAADPAQMERAIVEADRVIRARAEDRPELAGMGTTLVVLAADPDEGHATVGHVGDSRAYRLRDGVLELLTRDDSWVQDQIDAGLLEAGSARAHPFGSLVTQSLGSGENVHPNLWEGRLAPQDVFLLCTDGLTGMLEDDEIRQVMMRELPAGRLEGVAEALVDEANRNGGFDNITVALLRVTPPPAA